ncbi:MAG: AAA family ATPase [Gemmobacter sp.]
MNVAPDQIAPERSTDTPATPQACAIRRIRLVAAARAAFLHDLWTREETRDDAPLSRLTDPGDTAEAEALYRACNRPAAALLSEAEGLALTLAETETGGRFAHVARIFGLSLPEQALMHLAYAAETDPGLPAILAHVAPDGATDWPNPALATRLFGMAGWQADGAAARWHLLRRMAQGGGRPDRIALAGGLAEWLSGKGPAAPELLDIAETVAPAAPLPGWPAGSLAADLRRVFEAGPGAPVTVALDGVAGSGRRMFASAVADQLDLGLLEIDLARVVPAEIEAALRVAHRTAWLTGAALLLRGAAGPARLPQGLAPFPLVFRVDATPPAVDVAPTFRIRLPLPGTEERRALWQRFCPGAADWPAKALCDLSARHRATPGAIAAAAATAPDGPQAAAEALRRQDRERFGQLARRVEGRFVRDDLVLPERLARQFDILIAEARLRNRVWERDAVRRLFPLDRGLVVLFDGPPGTGKTMAAQVLAGELGLDLYRVNVSSLVSKWIGETMENVQRVLDAAEAADVVLLFDEADGFFARRTDLSTSNDRHANQDTGHLLQAIEAYPGTAILTSNRRRNIDEAFARRMRHILTFPLPDEAARLEIWTRTAAALFGPARTAALAPALRRIAARIELTGAHIKYAALSACFAAEAEAEAEARGGPDRLRLDHILAGIDGELMKDGRALSARDRVLLEGGT